MSIISPIGLGAGKILGVRRNFAQILPNLLEKYFKKVSSHKKLFVSIRAPLVSNQTMLGAIFAQIFREFYKVLRDFSLILEDFTRISWVLPGFSPNQNFWGYGFILLHPSLLHQ